MTKVGKRNIKTAIAVAICLIIYFIIIFIAHIFDKSYAKNIKIATQIYTPFFACLATAYSVGKDKENSVSLAKLRLSASIIGGVFGLLVVGIYQLIGFEWPFQHISATGNPTQDGSGLFLTGFASSSTFTAEDLDLEFLLSFIVPIILTGLSVVFVIWFCNLIKKPECSFISVLTLTAVMTSLGTNPIIYGPNRILSTVIGILVALMVNLIHIPHKKDDTKEFIIGIDNINKGETFFDGYIKYQLNNLIVDNANITLFTNQTPATLSDEIEDVKIKKPVICMSGAATYDFNLKKYIDIKNIKNSVSKELINLFNSLNVSPFINLIRNDLLYTYIKEIDNKAEEIYALNRKNIRYISFNLTEKAPEEDILYFIVVEKNEEVEKIKDIINNSNLKDELIMLTYTDSNLNEIPKGYSYLKIYSKDIKEFKYIDSLKVENHDTIGILTDKYDTLILDKLDYSITSSGSNEDLSKLCNLVINDNSKNNAKLFRKTLKIYHKRFKI